MIDSSNKLFIKQNYFINNTALICGGALHFKYLPPNNEFINENLYEDNKASYGNDYCSSPYKLILKEMNNYTFILNGNTAEFNITPSFTELNFQFNALDYFDKEIKDLNVGL